ncbi:MAG: hypothetical protein Unbinned4811contig1001_18 [Prokaryotic dsDNA virus sp.]|jgi:hypothetical protein|nr:MAG: hypothetical protein Unbinned4811contig1001_18 [Prokaryotic dsDNA virus sp.]
MLRTIWQAKRYLTLDHAYTYMYAVWNVYKLRPLVGRFLIRADDRKIGDRLTLVVTSPGWQTGSRL